MIAAVSCDKFGDDALTLDPGADAFIASIEGADTKTVIEGMKSYWSGTEGIRVLDGSLKGGKVYRAEVEEKSQTAIFSPIEATTPNADDYLAVYPEGPAGDVEWSGNIDKVASVFWLPGNQNAVAGSYDPSTHIAVAYTKAGNNVLDFKNVNALVKVVIPYDNITEVCFYGNNKEKIAGNFKVLYNGGEPVVSEATYDYAKISGEFVRGAAYYISILPQTFTEGFTIEFVMDGMKYVKKHNSKYILSRNQIMELPAIEYGQFEPEDGKVYLIPNEEWKGDAARFSAYFYDAASSNVWVDMTRVSNTYVYECSVPTDKDYIGVVFCRMNPSSTSNGWTQNTQLWNKTGDQLLCIGNQFKITGWDKGEWKGSPIFTDYLFLKPNDNWKKDGARFAAYFFGNGDTWVSLKDVNLDGIHEVRKPTVKKYPNVIFCRMDNNVPTNSWDKGENKPFWNKTSDLTIPTNGNNQYTVKEGTWDTGGGTWSKMTF